MISLSLAKSNDPRHQQRFVESGEMSAAAFAETIVRNIWSPIIWKDGVRTKSNFLYSDYFVLDFDAGKPIKEMIDFCTDMKVSAIIGTTKSHQKEKVAPSGKLTPACDRYRVIFKAASRCTDSELYRYNLGIMAEHFGCDESCSDAARFFYPCVDIAFRQVVQVGTVAWLPFDADYVPERVRYEARREKNRELGKTGILPVWMRSILNGEEVVEQERHKTVLRLGIILGEMGWTLESEWGQNVFSQIMKIPLGRHVGVREVQRHLENGYRIGTSNV